MKRSVQEIIELLVFGLIAVLIGTGLLWVVGWVIGGLGGLFKLLAGLIWSLLRFVVPIAVVGAAVYALVRLLQGQREPATSTASTGPGTAGSTGRDTPGPTGPGTAGSTGASATARPDATGSSAPGTGASATAAPSSTPPASTPPAETPTTHPTEPAGQEHAAAGEQVEDSQAEAAEGDEPESDEDVRRSTGAAEKRDREAAQTWENGDHVDEHHDPSDDDEERR